MDELFTKFKQAQRENSGYLLADTLSPVPAPSHGRQLRSFARSTNSASVERDVRSKFPYVGAQGLRLSRDEENAWIDVYVAFWKATNELVLVEDGASQHQAPWAGIYELWKDLTNRLIRGYTNSGFEAWTVPCLYVAGKYIRIFAIKADQEAGVNGTPQDDFQDDVAADFAKNQKLEDAARVLNRVFQVCLSDRAPLEESRKWGIYNIINLLFKTYFKLNAVSLSKNIISALRATRGDMPQLESFPMAHQVTFYYYLGVVHFLEEQYSEAETNLTTAFNYCLKDAQRNKELILTYLIPCRLLTTHTLPTAALLQPYPRLQQLFLPLTKCIKSGDLSGFDAALTAGEDEFVKRRIYLTLERGRDIALRNLLRKVFIAGGFDEQKDPAEPPIRRTRVPVAEFAAAISIGGKQTLETDEVECLLANMIYKNLMKGYIARDRGIVVLSKGGAFPGTGV